MPDTPSDDDATPAEPAAADEKATEATTPKATSPPTPPTPPIAAEPIAPIAPVAAPDNDPGYTASGVPTFDSVREKIETRYGTALGSTELAADTPEGRSVEEQYEARQKAAAERLEEIRASMHNQQHDDS
jgi:hypothetical protein